MHKIIQALSITHCNHLVRLIFRPKNQILSSSLKKSNTEDNKKLDDNNNSVLQNSETEASK